MAAAARAGEGPRWAGGARAPSAAAASEQRAFKQEHGAPQTEAEPFAESGLGTNRLLSLPAPSWRRPCMASAAEQAGSRGLLANRGMCAPKRGAD